MAHLLKDRSVLVIGRAGGIAQATATAIQAAGGQVIAAGRNLDELKAAYNDTVDVESIDVTDEDSMADLANRLGTVDHVVTTASARAYGKVQDLEPASIMLSLATKVIGPLMLVKHFEPRMPRDGSFVLLGGIRSRQPLPGSSAVTATNGAVDAMTRALALELAPIRVNAISPGTIDTGAWDRLGGAGQVRALHDPGEAQSRTPDGHPGRYRVGGGLRLDEHVPDGRGDSGGRRGAAGGLARRRAPLSSRTNDACAGVTPDGDGVSRDERRQEFDVRLSPDRRPWPDR